MDNLTHKQTDRQTSIICRSVGVDGQNTWVKEVTQGSRAKYIGEKRKRPLHKRLKRGNNYKIGKFYFGG